MIALAEEKFEPTPEQKQIKRLLQEMTGLGVRIQPVIQPGEMRSTSVVYIFKAQARAGDLAAAADDEERQSEIKAKATHGLHDYVKTLFMEHADFGYDKMSVSIVHDVDDQKNSLWPCVQVKLSGLSGYAHSNDQSLSYARELKLALERYAREHSTPPSIEFHAQKLRNQLATNGMPFDDGYANQIEKH